MDNNPSTSSGHGNNFFSGFLLGALVGGIIVFLLGTEKGKKILKTISEEGMDNLNKVIEKADKAINLDEAFEEEGDDEIPSKAKVIAREVAEDKPKTRRFFRGVSRHLN